MPTRLILVRHGRTKWNAQKRYLGVTDIPLDGEGARQAERVRRKLKSEKVSKVYSSDSKRALDFAKVTFRDCPIEKRRELREMDFGIFEGMTYSRVMKKYPALYTNWLRDPFNTTIPKGESFKDVKERVLEIFREITAINKNRTLAVVTHAGPIRIIISDILKSKKFWDIMPDLGGINIVEFRRGKLYWVR